MFVVWGVEKRSRKSYRIWDEGGVVPAFVVEVASLSASRRDATRKRATDEPMGAREYWRFERVPETGPAGWQRSEVLGLELRPEEWLLRFCDPRLGRDLVTHPEASRALQESGR